MKEKEIGWGRKKERDDDVEKVEMRVVIGRVCVCV
jgi:hypothetical protein